MEVLCCVDVVRAEVGWKSLGVDMVVGYGYLLSVFLLGDRSLETFGYDSTSTLPYPSPSLSFPSTHQDLYPPPLLLKN